MKIKNFNKFLIGLAIVSSGLAGTVLYNSNIHSGLVVKNKATNDISWVIDDNGNIYPTDKSKVSGAIEIPSVWDGKPVTGIANYSFSACKKLISITIPNSVTSIGIGAFWNCISLTSVTFAENSKLNSIGKNAFAWCGSLTNISIPNSVTSIGNSAFWNCSALTSINIPSSVTSISIQAFKECSSLTSVNFAEDSQLTTIGAFAFNDCGSLKNINIPSSVTSIESQAFSNCSSLTDVTFNWDNGQLVPNKLTLGTDLFNNTSSSQTINFHIPLGTKDQYKAKFTQDILGTNITANWISYIQWSITNDGLISPADKRQIQGEITIPDTVDEKVVTGIAESAFNGCSALTSVNFAEGSKLNSIGKYAFSECASLTSVNIPSSVTTINDGTFAECSSLTSITIPRSVTSIDDNAFNDCSSLTTINFDVNSRLTSIGINAFDRCGSLATIDIPDSVTTINNGVFNECKSLKTIDIPSGVTSIGKNAFADCSSLTTINFDVNSRLTNIGKYAFSECASLTSINIPSSVTTINDGTFAECSSLTSITIPRSVTSIADYAFADCSSLTNITFAEGSKLTSIGVQAFSKCALTSINIPNSVTRIDTNAFRNCSSLKDVTFNWNEEQLNKLQLDNSLFINHTSSQTIIFHIPLGTKDQYKAKFTQDILGTNITANWIDDIQWNITDAGLISPADKRQIQGEITIPDTVDEKVVTGIAESAFNGCSALTSVNFAEGSKLNSIGKYAFSECASLTSIAIPRSVTSIGKNAFADCSSLTNITFAEGSKLTSIGVQAFSKCALTSINIPNSVTRIDTNAFRNCSSLKDVTFNWNEEQLNKLQLDNSLFINHTSSQTIIFHIPLGTKDQYKAKFTQDILGTNITANWIDDIVPPTPTPTNSSNLALILGLTFGFIILIGIGSYLGYRYYKHRKNRK